MNRTTKSTAIYELPEWVRLNASPSVPAPWKALASTFARIVGAVLMRDRPNLALINVVDRGTQMGIHFRISPAQDAETMNALRDVAFCLAELSIASRPSIDGPPASSDGMPISSDTLDAALKCAQVAPVSDSVRPLPLDLDQNSAPSMRVFTWDAPSAVNRGLHDGRNDETATRIKRTLNRLQGTGTNRLLVPPAQDWRSQLDALEVAFPNFASVVRSVVRPHVALTALGYRHRMPPLLLLGAPGVGKTFFARSLHRALGIPVPLFISMASETNGAGLSGSSTFWSNSSPGQLFERLAFGGAGEQPVANPIVVIDEIDKVSARDYDPLAALYGLLEAETAASFRDQSLPDITIDASQVRFILTANDASRVPEPLLSRMMVFEIESPSSAQADTINLSIFEMLVRKLGLETKTALSEQILVEARVMSPRKVKTRLDAAIGHAVMHGRSKVEFVDWQAVGAGSPSGSGARIGFIHQTR